MRVGIDTGPLVSGDSVRGVGEYTRQLLRLLKATAKKKKDLRIEEIDIAKTELTDLDLVHIPHFNPFRLTIPESVTTKIVITIHDLIPLVYPKHYPSGLRGWLNLQTQKKRLTKVDAIITDSETSKKDTVRFLGVGAKKVHPVYLAAGGHFKNISKDASLLKKVIKKFKLPKKFVLYVGDVNYNKNILTLIKSCEIVKVKLVIVGKQAQDIEDVGADIRNLSGPRDVVRFLFGKPHPEIAHYNELLSEFRQSSEVIRTGFVSTKELVAIYNLATVYCQPSFYEGFGLPVLEAMSCGTPVVIAKNNCLVEIADEAAILADPSNPKDMADKISKVMKNTKLRNSLIIKGVERAKHFSWEKTAEATIEVYKKVLNG